MGSALSRWVAILVSMCGSVTARSSQTPRAIAASRARNTPIFLGRELVLLATARRRAGAPEREIQPLVEEAQQIAGATGAHLIDQEIARYGLSPARPTQNLSRTRVQPGNKSN